MFVALQPISRWLSPLAQALRKWTYEVASSFVRLAAEPLLTRNLFYKTRIKMRRDYNQKENMVLSSKLFQLNKYFEKIYLFCFGWYSAGLKDICETQTQHLNIILLRQRCWIEEEPRLLDLSCLEFTGPTMKSLALGVQSGVKFKPCCLVIGNHWLF